MSAQKNREIHLKSRPRGLPSPDNFALVERPLPTARAGQILVRNLWMSVDPYMRGRMVDRKSYIPPFQIGEALQGGAVGQVEACPGNGRFRPGDYVMSMYGWREWFVCDDADLQKIDKPLAAPLQTYLGAFGMTGLTAYTGLLKAAELKDGERVFISAASGAVGQIACQIAKIRNCYVVGAAGSDEKCKSLTDEFGVDRAINYRKAGDLSRAVADAFPDGIDVYFDNVGGTHLAAALDNMREYGRISVCGMIEQYNMTEPPHFSGNLLNIVGRALTIRGFMVKDHFDLQPAFLRDMSAWAKQGKMKWSETIVEGIDKAPAAFIGLFKGDNIGKMLVKLGEETR